MSLIPTTILTGFLGAGKTTLLKRILEEPHGLKIAVIENEFGQENIDSDILVQDGTEQIIEMNNGCICCTVRGDLIVALSALARRRDAGEIKFDRVIIETTGLDNPGPVAQTFFIDEEVASRYLIDAIITLVDAQHAMHQLDSYQEAQRQVGFADKIFLSKTDLVDDAALRTLTDRIRRINPRAPVSHANFGRASIAEVMDLRGFNLNDKLEIDANFLSIAGSDDDRRDKDKPAHGEDCDKHGDDSNAHCDDDAHNHDHGRHTDDIAAFVFQSERPFNTVQLDEFLGAMVQVFGPQMLRYKGVLWMEGADRKVIFQGVHQIMGTDIGGKWAEDEKRASKMVFIGQKLPRETFIGGLEQCLV